MTLYAQFVDTTFAVSIAALIRLIWAELIARLHLAWSFVLASHGLI